MTEDKKLDPQVSKERIGKHLRAADELTHQQRYDEAILEIEQALEIDPKHNYARSFLERVKMMHKRSQPKESDQADEEDKSLEERTALISQHLAAAEDFINKKDYPHALEEVAKVYKIDPKNYYAQTYSERIDILMNDKGIQDDKPVATLVQPAAPEIPPVIQSIQLPSQQIQSRQSQLRGSTVMYRELLKEVWFDGKVTDEESQELASLRDLFRITWEEHVELEHEIKIEAYLEALRIAWRDHSLSGLEQKALQMMLEKYAISKEEQAEAEARYADIKQSTKPRGDVLIVDANREMLVSLGKLMTQRGFAVLMAQKVEDALKIINSHVPNFIFSDILFAKDQMDGVEFLKKLIESSILTKSKFIFISSVTDKKVIQACYRLGADHVLVKPVDKDVLLSIVEGILYMTSSERLTV